MTESKSPQNEWTIAAQAVKAKLDALWLEENYEAIVSSNAYVEKNGLPLEQYRGFYKSMP